MAQIQPFAAWMPTPAMAEKVASPPYDVMNRQEARHLLSNEPHSFLQVVRADACLPDSVDAYDSEIYNLAKTNFANFVNKGWLVQANAPAYYLYGQTMDGHRQLGLVALCSVNDYRDNVIKKHEFTRPAKEQDRIKTILTTGLQTGPVLMAYRQQPEIDALVNKVSQQKRHIDFVSADGIRHEFWQITDNNINTQLSQLFAQKVPAIYIADGHHRAASAEKVATILSQKDDTPSDDAPYNWFLSVLFPDNQLQILDYNRVVKDLNGLSETEFLAALTKDFEVVNMGATIYKPKSNKHELSIYLNNNWYKLQAKPHTYKQSDPIQSLEVDVMSRYILAPILGITNQRTAKNIDFVGGIRGLKELKKRVDSGEMQLGIAIPPVSVDQLFAVADAQKVMPPKSTWFEPKLRSGLASYAIK